MSCIAFGRILSKASWPGSGCLKLLVDLGEKTSYVLIHALTELKMGGSNHLCAYPCIVRISNIPSSCCAGIKNLPKHCFAIAGVFFFVCFFLPMFRSVCTEQQLVFFCTCQRACLYLFHGHVSQSLQALSGHLVLHRQCIECHVRYVECALNIIKAEGHSPHWPMLLSLHEQLLYTVRSNQQGICCLSTH